MSRYNGKYDPADFIVPPEVGKGKAMRIQAYVQSAHYRAMSIVARSGVFPFEEVNDVLRWSIRLGLERLDHLEPRYIGSVMRQAAMMIRHNREEVYRQAHVTWLAGVKTTVDQLIGEGEIDAAKAEVRYHYDQIMSMPDEPEYELRWKQKYHDTLMKHFSAMILEVGGNGQ